MSGTLRVMGGDAEKIFSWTGIVPMDYGQFQLSVRLGTEEFADYEDTIDDMAVLNAALDGSGIAQYGPVVIILSPHQNNFAMPLDVEVWEARLPADLDDWEETFEVWLDVDETGLAFQSPTLSKTVIPVPAGRYHVLVSGRGFVAQGWPGSTNPGDQWRIALTPVASLGTPTHLSASVYSPSRVGEATPVARPDASPKRESGEYASTGEPVLHDRGAGSDIERAVQHVVETCPESRRKALALAAARRACELANLTAVSWVCDAIESAAATGSLPAQWNNDEHIWGQLYTGTGVPETTGVDAGTGSMVHLQSEAVEALFCLRIVEPTTAATQAIRQLTRVCGNGYQSELLALDTRSGPGDS